MYYYIFIEWEFKIALCINVCMQKLSDKL
jgi:hypothetical protein